jgi:hypothetical protein
MLRTELGRGRRLLCLLPPLALAASACLGDSDAVRTDLGEPHRAPAGSSGGEACNPCRLSLEHVATLGSINDPAARTGLNHVARAPDGGFYAFPRFQPPQVARYRADGSFHSIYVRGGQGPGELASEPRAFMPVGNSLIVAELRLHLFEEGFQPVWTAPRPIVGHRNYLLADGAELNVIALEGEDGHSYLIHIVRRDEAGKPEEVRSVYRLPPGSTIARRPPGVSPAPDGGFWVVEANRSTFDRFDGWGEHLRQVELNRPWFTPWDEPPPGNGTERPPVPRTMEVRELGGGRAVVTTFVASPDWAPRSPGPVYLGTTDRGGQDTLVELVDLATGEVLGSVQVPWLLRFVEGPGELLVHAPESMPTQDVSIHVWRLRIEPEGP